MSCGGGRLLVSARGDPRRKVSAIEVVEAHLRRFEEVNASLGALLMISAAEALQQARDLDQSGPPSIRGFAPRRALGG